MKTLNFNITSTCKFMHFYFEEGFSFSRCMRPYKMESSRACQLASITFSETPIVPQVFSPSDDSIKTRTTAEVPLFWFKTLTLKSVSSILASPGKQLSIASLRALSRAFTGPFPSAVFIILFFQCIYYRLITHLGIKYIGFPANLLRTM